MDPCDLEAVTQQAHQAVVRDISDSRNVYRNYMILQASREAGLRLARMKPLERRLWLSASMNWRLVQIREENVDRSRSMFGTILVQNEPLGVAPGVFTASRPLGVEPFPSSTQHIFSSQHHFYKSLC